jgi:purine catabolism regulator
MQRPSASLKTLIRLAALKPVRYLTGAGQAAETVVYWIVTDLETGRPGDVLLIPAARAAKNLLAKMKAKEMVGLLLHGSGFQAGWAVSAGFPILEVPAEPDLDETHRLLLTVLIDQQARMMEMRSRISAQLDRLVADGEGYPGLVRAIAELSGRGVVVQDKRLNILSATPSPTLLEVWETLGTELQEFGQLPEVLRDRKQVGKSPVFLHQALPGDLMRLVTPINVGGVARGYLSLVGQDGDLDDLDQVIADQGALAVAVQMSRSKAVREAEKRLRSDLLNALLQDTLSARDAELWAETMGLDLTQAHVPLRFAWHAESNLSLRRLETLVNGEVARLGRTVIVSLMGSEVICFCQVPPGPGVPELAMELGQNVLKRAGEEPQEGVVLCGLGPAAEDLNAWGVSFRQAGQALEMARRLSADRPLYFPALSVYRLLLQIEHTPELIDFEREILGSLLAYETGSELIRTLQAYFEHNGNLSQTAESLYIHRNSLLYRMERIAEISGLDLGNSETRLAVQLALHIHQMRSAGG